jgi:TPP-dependent indolepyruvate ferredoxin oxidoreductase alpha subunit
VIEPLPKNNAANVALIRRELEYRGLSVIIPRRACIHVKRQSRDRGPSGAGVRRGVRLLGLKVPLTREP